MLNSFGENSGKGWRPYGELLWNLPLWPTNIVWNLILFITYVCNWIISCQPLNFYSSSKQFLAIGKGYAVISFRWDFRRKLNHIYLQHCGDHLASKAACVTSTPNFPGNCVITYWKTGRWLGPVACPNCRQTVTVLMNSFTTEELREEDSELKNTILAEVLNYNRRFSGEPRSVSKYFPTVFKFNLCDK